MRNAAKKILDKTSVDNRLIGASKRLKEEVRKNMATAILAAFAFMIALVWRDVVQQGVNKLVEYLHLQGDGYTFTVITAVVTTVICVFGMVYFSRWSEKK